MGCVESAQERDAKRQREGMAMQGIDHRRNGPRAKGDDQRRQGAHSQKKQGSRQTKALAKGVDIATQTEQAAGLLLRRVSSRLKQRRKKTSEPPDPNLLFDLNRSVALTHSKVAQYIQGALDMPAEQKDPEAVLSNGSITSSVEAPVSTKDKELLQGCWMEVQKDLAEFGVDLFVRFLEENPTIGELFPFGKLNLSPERLRQNVDLQAHGLRVMETFGAVVEGLGEWELIVPILEDLAARHKVYGATHEHFTPLQDAFMYSLRNGLPPKVFTAEVQEAWLNLWKEVATVMGDAMREGRGFFEKQDEGPISARDRRLVQGSWKAVEKDLINFGAELFVRLLERNPSIKNLFPFGKLNLSPEKLRDNRDLRAHGKNVMTSIGMAVEMLDSPDKLVSFLEDLGAKHKAYGAKPQHFQPLAEAFMFSLKDGLPPKVFTAEVQEAWKNVLKVVAELMSPLVKSQEPDSVPLSLRDKRLVRECWKVIQKDMVNLGAALFIRLLEQNPEIQKLFAFGKLNLAPEELKRSKDLRSHGQRVMSTIGAVVMGLDDPDIVTTILEELGARHKTTGAKPEHFPALVEAFMYSMRNGLSPKVFTSAVQDAWQNLMKIVATTMNKTMRSDSAEDDGPITANDKRVVQASWKIMEKDALNLGATLFARLLEKNPGVQKLFPFGKLNLPTDKLKQNPELRAHGKGVMETIGALVAGLNDLEKMVPTLKQLGARHKIYGAKPEHFPALVEAFMYTVKTGVSAQVFTAQVQEAWGKVLKVVGVTMSSTMGYENGVPEEEPNASSISSQDKQLVQKSWNVIQKDLVNVGAVTFVRFLEQNPSLQNLFPFGKLKLPPGKLKQNAELRAHGKGVMETIGKVVAGMDDLGKVVPVVEDLGARHKIYGARPEHFPAVTEAFMYSLKQSLSPNVFTSETQEAWRKVLAVVGVTMSRTMRSDENGVPEGDTNASLIPLQDKQLVQRNWKVIQKDLDNLGAVMFIRLLQQNPSLQNLFPFGKLKLPPGKLKQNAELRAHGKGVMETIGKVVAGMDDLGKVVPIVEELGARHKIYGAKPEHFPAVTEAFIYSLKQSLSPNVFTSETQEAWRKVLSVVGATMSRTMRSDENGVPEEETNASLISSQDKQLVQKSWKVIQKDLDNLGAAMFVRLLEQNPSLQNLFPFGKLKLPPGKLKQNAELRAHGKGVMETIGKVVAGMDDLGKVVPVVEDLGARHKIYGARPEHFPAVTEAFMYSLKQSLSPNVFTSETQEAWRNVLSVVGATMSRTMRLDENGNSEEGLISPKDKQLVQKSWKVMQKDSVNLGAALFARLLDRNPSIRQLFSFGKSSAPPQMLKHNSDLREHGKGVMETIGVVVSGLDDLGKIVPILDDLGARHRVYGAKPEHFQPLLEAFMHTMKTGLPAKEFTPEVQSAWENIWKVLAEVMSNSME